MLVFKVGDREKKLSNLKLMMFKFLLMSLDKYGLIKWLLTVDLKTLLLTCTSSYPPTRLWPHTLRRRPFLFACLGGSDSHVTPLGLDVHSLFLHIPITLGTCVIMLIKPTTTLEVVFNFMILDNPIL